MRRDNWHDNLTTIVRMHKSQPYVWGKFDCITFVSHAIGVMTGVDRMKNIPEYETELGAIKALKSTGYFSTYDYFFNEFNAVHSSILRPGDLGFQRIDSSVLVAPYVVLGAQAINRDKLGWNVVDTNSLSKCLRVD